jgi:hypothetical protein
MLLAFLLVLLSESSQGPRQQQPRYRQYESASYQRGTEKAPVVIKLDSVERNRVARQDEQQRLDKKTADDMAIRYTKYSLFTNVGLVAFTFGLWWVTRGLVSGAENTARHQLRAYVSVRPHALEGELVPLNPLVCKIRLLNHGLTPAIDMTFTMSKLILPFPLPSIDLLVANVDPDPLPLLVLQPRQRQGGASNKEIAPVSTEDISRLRRGENEKGEPIRLYCFGIVKYWDVFGREHWTNYCHYYEPWAFSGEGKVTDCANCHLHNDIGTKPDTHPKWQFWKNKPTD